MHEFFDPDQVFRIVDIAAVVANGLLGGAVARAFRFDIVGFLLLAVACGMGGGMIRDILLNSGLPVALTDGGYWIGAIGSSILAYSIDLSARWATRTLLVVDFVGMGCWAATGTIKSLNLGLHWLPSITLGITTAVGGGLIRDIMVNRIPAIFGGNSLYATVALVGAAETALVTGLFHRPNLAMALSILLCLILGGTGSCPPPRAACMCTARACSPSSTAKKARCITRAGRRVSRSPISCRWSAPSNWMSTAALRREPGPAGTKNSGRVGRYPRREPAHPSVLGSAAMR